MAFSSPKSRRCRVTFARNDFSQGLQQVPGTKFQAPSSNLSNRCLAPSRRALSNRCLAPISAAFHLQQVPGTKFRSFTSLQQVPGTKFQPLQQVRGSITEGTLQQVPGTNFGRHQFPQGCGRVAMMH